MGMSANAPAGRPLVLAQVLRLRFRHLQFLDILGRTRNLRLTAEQMHITQPAATKVLMDIEEMLEARLFDRLPRGMRPNELGLFTLRYVHTALDGHRKFVDEFSTLKQGGHGHLSIGAISGSAAHLLIAAVAASVDRGARAIVLTGTGRVFSAGADLDAARAGLATSPLWETLSAAIAAAPALTIAALNGTAAGGALGMVLACDLRIAVPAAKIFYPVMRLGFLPQPSDPTRLAALAGPSRAAMILMAGQKIEAAEAHSWGLIDRIVPEGALLDCAAAVAADALAAAPAHVGGIKALIRG